MRSDFVLEKGALLYTLNHQANRNRNMPVRVDFDSGVAPPQIISGSWAVPCDVVGLDSKKAKYIKIRFHPSLTDLCRSDRLLADAAHRDAIEFLDALLEGSEWTRHAVRTPDSRVCHLNKISKFLSMRKGILVAHSDSFDVIWPLHSGGDQNIETCVQEARTSLQNHSISSGLVVNIENIVGGANQEVTMQFKKKELVRPLLRLLVTERYLQSGTFNSIWQISNESFHIKLPRANSDAERLPAHLPSGVSCTVFEKNQELPIMLDASQLRVEDLRRRLDDSLASFQRSTSLRDKKARGLYVFKQNRIETVIEISQPGVRPCLDRILASVSPLNVICDGNGSGDLATSPAESTDSGVCLSPLMSPVGKHSPFYQYSEENRLCMRQRSVSECGDWTCSGIKGILKKPKRSGRFTRSISECHTSEHDEVHLSLIRSSTAEVDESADENQGDRNESEMPARKKHVSFSEKVQERRFKVGQCILSQSKKNEKKRQQKKRKEVERQRSMSEDSDGSTEHMDDVIGAKLVSKLDSEAKPCVRSARQDSGFMDGDDISPPPILVQTPEEGWKNVLRQQRKISNH